jgi:hypothetical protein
MTADMWLRETALDWMDGTPADDRPRFRRLAQVVHSCFDSCFEGLQTDYVGKVAIGLWSRPVHPDLFVNPKENDREVTVVMVERAYDAARLLTRSDEEALEALLQVHVDSLL